MDTEQLATAHCACGQQSGVGAPAMTEAECLTADHLW